MEEFCSALSGEISSLDADISASIQEQSCASKTAQSDMRKAREASVMLQAKIEGIREKAVKSEEMVKAICSDIKQLDYAKRHLQTTVTALKRLHMLTNAVHQLSETSESNQFKEAADLLEAVQQLMLGFETFTNVPKIMEIKAEIERVRGELSRGVFRAFDEIGELASSTADPEGFVREDHQQGGFKTLGEACLVVDALGKEAKEKQVESFCSSQLKSYKSIFSPDCEHSSLDQIDRRFSWFRRLMKSLDERFVNVFPPHWHVQYKLCWVFLEQTREGIMSVLQDDSSSDSQNVILIVKGLQRAIMFEKEMTARLERDYGSSVATTTVDPNRAYDNSMEYDDDGNEIDPRSAQGIKLRYAREKAKQVAIKLKTGDTSPPEEDHALLPLVGMLSGSFMPFMGPYVALEKSNIEELLQKAKEDKATDQRGELPVFTSAVNFFVYIKNSINRCTALTTGVVFFNLYKQYKASLGDYSKMLHSKMPQPFVQNALMAGLANAGGTDKPPPNPRTSNYKIPPGEEEVVCLAIDTCEYCVDTIDALAELIKDKVDEPFKESIDLMDVQDEFNDVTSVGLRILVSGLESRLDPFFKELSSTSWSSFDDVGEESAYVRQMHSSITTFVGTVQRILPTSYYRNFCDKFATSFMATFHATLVKCKRFSQIATQQLLLDVYSLKGLIQRLPALNQDGALAPTMYVTHTSKEFAKIEILLKLVGTPTESLVEVFRQQWTDGTLKDLQQVMGLKGLKRVQQTELLESFGS